MSASTDLAWNDGFEAFHDGMSETRNPYDVKTDEHLSWNDGYLYAREGDPS